MAPPKNIENLMEELIWETVAGRHNLKHTEYEF